MDSTVRSMTRRRQCCETPALRPINKILPSLGSNGRKDSTFPSYVTVVFYDFY